MKWMNQKSYIYAHYTTKWEEKLVDVQRIIADES